MIDAALLRFLVVGLANTGLGVGVIFAARQVVDDYHANLIGYLLVVPVSFFSHRGWSFRDSGRWLPALARFLPAVLVGYVLNVGTLSFCLDTGANPYLAQACALTTYVLFMYVVSRYAVFRSPRRDT